MLDSWIPTFYKTPQFVAKIHKDIGCNKYNEYFLHTFNENVIVATDNKQNNDSNGFARTDTNNIREYLWNSDAKNSKQILL